MRTGPLLAALALVLAACSPAGESTDSGSEGDAAVDAAPAQPGEDRPIELTGTGISLPADGTVEALEIPFGSNRAATEATIAQALGEPSGRMSNGECGAGPMEFTKYPGLTLNFQEGKLVGWSADAAPYLPATRRGDLEAQGGLLKVEGSTLGEEFTIGADPGPIISGLFSGPGDDAKVETLWAGTNCIFR